LQTDKLANVSLLDIHDGTTEVTILRKYSSSFVACLFPNAPPASLIQYMQMGCFYQRVPTAIPPLE